MNDKEYFDSEIETIHRESLMDLQLKRLKWHRPS